MEMYLYQGGMSSLFFYLVYWMLGKRQNIKGFSIKFTIGILLHYIVCLPAISEQIAEKGNWGSPITHILGLIGQIGIYCWLFQGTVTKKIFAGTMAEIILMPNISLGNLLYLPFQQSGKSIWDIQDDYVHVCCTLFVMYLTFPLTIKILNKPVAFFRNFDFGHSWIEKILMFSHLGYTVFGNVARFTQGSLTVDRYLHTLQYVGIVILGGFVLVLYCNFKIEQKQNLYLHIQKKILQSHLKVLENQMIFSKNIRIEIQRQMDLFLGEKRTIETEIGEYRERLLDLTDEWKIHEYCQNLFLNAYLQQEIQKLEEKIGVVNFKNKGISGKEYTADQWLQIFEELFRILEETGVFDEQENQIFITIGKKNGWSFISIKYPSNTSSMKMNWLRRKSEKLLGENRLNIKRVSGNLWNILYIKAVSS